MATTQTDSDNQLDESDGSEKQEWWDKLDRPLSRNEMDRSYTEMVKTREWMDIDDVDDSLIWTPNVDEDHQSALDKRREKQEGYHERNMDFLGRPVFYVTQPRNHEADYMVQYPYREYGDNDRGFENNIGRGMVLK